MASNARATTDGDALSFMEKLSPEVFIYRPPPLSSDLHEPAANNDQNVATSTTPPPKLVLMAAWGGALDTHISKYIVKYQALYPSAQILLVKSTRKLFFNPHLVAAAVRPAIPVIKACLQTPPSSSSSSSSPSSQPAHPELLVHIFSMGGTSSIVHIFDAYAEASSDQDPDGRQLLPHHVTILDSCPTVFSGSALVTFLNMPLPNAAARILAAPIVYILSYTWAVLVAIGLLPDKLTEWGDKLNSAANKTEVRRAYIYSDADELVDARNVEANADDAERKGFHVARRERFEGSKHVAHARKDDKRYWGVVIDIWEGKHKL